MTDLPTENRIEGDLRTAGGTAKGFIGSATDDEALVTEGRADRLTGRAQAAYGDATAAFADKAGPLANQAKQFAREKPWAVAALAGVLGLALLNTLRGKR